MSEGSSTKGLSFTPIPVFKPAVPKYVAKAGGQTNSTSSAAAATAATAVAQKPVAAAVPKANTSNTPATSAPSASATAALGQKRKAPAQTEATKSEPKKVQLELNPKQAAIMKALAMATQLSAELGKNPAEQYKTQAKYLDRVIQISEEEKKKREAKREKLMQRREKRLQKKLGEKYIPPEERLKKNKTTSSETSTDSANSGSQSSERIKMLAALAYQLRAKKWDSNDGLGDVESKINEAAMDMSYIADEVIMKQREEEKEALRQKRQRALEKLQAKLDNDEDDDENYDSAEDDDDLMYDADADIEEGKLPATDETLRQFDVVRRPGEAGDEDEEYDDLGDEHKKKPLPKLGTRVHETPDEEEQNHRTIFLGNVPMECNDKMLKAFVCQEGSGLKSTDIESMRFRSVAVASLKVPRKVAVWKNMTHSQRNSKNAYVVLKPHISNQQLGAAIDFLHNRVMNESHHIQADFAAPTPMIPNRSIFVGNLPFNINEESLIRYFNQVGEVHRVRVIRDPAILMGKGVAYVEFKSPDSVSPAMALEGDDIEGRPLRVQRMLPASKLAKSRTKAREAKKKGLPRRADKTPDIEEIVRQRREAKAEREAKKGKGKSRERDESSEKPQLRSKYDEATLKKLKQFERMSDEERAKLPDEERRKLRRLLKAQKKREEKAAAMLRTQRTSRIGTVRKGRSKSDKDSALVVRKPWMGQIGTKK